MISNSDWKLLNRIRACIDNEGKDFYYEEWFMINCHWIEEENFKHVVKSWWRCIWHIRAKNQTEEYNTSLYNNFVDDNGEVFIYPKEIDSLTKKELEREANIIVQNIYIERLQFFSLNIISKEIIYEEEEDMHSTYEYCVLKFTIQSTPNTKQTILSYLKEEFSNNTQYSLTKFYEILVTNYQKYWRDDWMLIIKWFEEVWYDGLFAGILYFYYTNDIELIDHSSQSFTVKLLAFDKTVLNIEKSHQLVLSSELEEILHDDKTEAIKITKDNKWELHMIFRESYVHGKDMSFIDVCKQHPHAEIETVSYEWKPNGYKVTDKIKIWKKDES